MDGLASLAAAANLVEFQQQQQQQSSNNSGPPSSPLKRKTSFKGTTPASASAPSPRKKKRKDDSEVDQSQEFQSLPTFEQNSEIPGGAALIERLSFALNTNLRLRCIHEWFYPTLDRDYFDENEFIGCLTQLGLQKYTSLTRSQWSYLRCVIGSKIGRPRRFSPAFLSSERGKLQRYRQSARSIQFGCNSTLLLHDFPYQVYDPVDVGDCVTVYHIPSASLQRGLVLSLHSFSPSSAEYLIQYDSLALGHGVVSDDLIAIHGEVPIRYQRRRLYETEEAPVGSGDEEGERSMPLSLDTLGLPPPSHLNFSPSFRSSLEDLWRRCVKESSQRIQRMLCSSSLPPPPTISLLTSSNYTSPSVPISPSSLLLSSAETKAEQEMTQSSVLESCHVPSPEDSSLEELLVPLLASLLFLKNADGYSFSFSPSSSPTNKHSSTPNPNHSSSSSSSLLLRDIHGFLLDKIREVYSLSPAMAMSLSQLFDSLLKLLFQEEPDVTPVAAAAAPGSSSLFLPPPAFRPSSLLSSGHQSMAASRISRPTHAAPGSAGTSIPSSAPLRSLSSSSPGEQRES